MLDLTRESFDGAAARALTGALDAELDERYPQAFDDPPAHLLADYAPPRGAFVVARLGGDPVGCGGLRPGPQPGTGEVKRMYVVPRLRGQRLAEQLLTELTLAARELGVGRLVLETGTGQPEALRLYARLGWQPVPGFGHYRDSPLSRCFALELP